MSGDPAEAMAAVWRAAREEAHVLQANIARLEHGVARAMLHPPPAESVAAWIDLLAEQRAALAASRARGAQIAALLDGDAA